MTDLVQCELINFFFVFGVLDSERTVPGRKIENTHTESRRSHPIPRLYGKPSVHVCRGTDTDVNRKTSQQITTPTHVDFLHSPAQKLVQNTPQGEPVCSIGVLHSLLDHFRGHVTMGTSGRRKEAEGKQYGIEDLLASECMGE